MKLNALVFVWFKDNCYHQYRGFCRNTLDVQCAFNGYSHIYAITRTNATLQNSKPRPTIPIPCVHQSVVLDNVWSMFWPTAPIPVYCHPTCSVLTAPTPIPTVPDYLPGLGGLSQGQLVAGPWGDCSPHLHKLLRYFADQRVTAEGRASGLVPGPGSLGKIVGEVRRAASVTIVRSQHVCLLERLAFLAPGAKAAAQRRQITLRQLERRRRENQAYSLAFQRGGLGREGRAYVP